MPSPGPRRRPTPPLSAQRLPDLISPPPIQKPGSRSATNVRPPVLRRGFWSSISDLHWIAFLVSSLILAATTVALALSFRPSRPLAAPRLIAQIDGVASTNDFMMTVRVDPSIRGTKEAAKPKPLKETPVETSPQSQPRVTAPATSPPSGPAPAKTPATGDEAPRLNLSSRIHRTANLRDHGGSTESERAVERGLRWLIAHQSSDGSWRFDLSNGVCNGYCRNRGTEPTTTGATGLALLAFLGAGYTNQEGEYQLQIERALYYLRNRARPSGRGVDLTEGVNRGLYGHAIATIALCEAYALTQDLSLKDLAQRAIHFIVDAQDMKGGGWRYVPRSPGDTTVTGWQVMALKCAEMARLDVPSPSFVMAQHFLDTVQTDDGAQYDYMPTQRTRTHATTAIGLLTRMYLGWQVNDRRLTRGVAMLSAWGPSQGESPKVDLYYNYYATQIMHHWGSVNWLQWNTVMRDFLVKTQAAGAHESGSWHFDGGYGNLGGRLYNTAMSIMTLEVYYRYIPIYRPDAVRR